MLAKGSPPIVEEPVRVTVLSAFTRGLGHVFSSKRILVILWGFSIVFAYIAVLPLKTSFHDFLQDKPIAEILRAKPDMLYFQEWVLRDAGIFAVFGALILVITLCYWVLNIFTAGGILGTFSADRSVAPGGLRRFFSAGVEYFGPFLRLGLLTFGIYAILILLFTAFYQKYDGEFSYKPFWIQNTILFGLTFFLISIVNLIADYAKIRIVAAHSRRAINGLIYGAQFVFKFPGRTLGLYYLNLGMLSTVVIAYLFLDEVFTADAAPAVVAVFFIQQIVILLRVLIRMQFFGSELVMFVSNPDDTVIRIDTEVRETGTDQAQLV